MEGHPSGYQIGIGLLEITVLLTVIKISVFYYLGLYNRFWVSASIDELARLVASGIISLILGIILFLFFRVFVGNPISAFPLSLPVFDNLITMSLVALSRYSIRFVEVLKYRKTRNQSSTKILIVGAGNAGRIVLNELLRNPSFGKIVGFIDDDPKKVNLKIKNVQILGSTLDMGGIISNYNIDKLIIAMPSASGKKIKEIMDDCKNLPVEILTVPSLYSIFSNNIKFNSLRKVNVEDLLRRKSVKTNIVKLLGLIENEVVLITGAGGSIGSELVRQIINYNPLKIILLGRGENSIFNITQELLESDPKLRHKVVPVIADIRNKNRLEYIFDKYSPQIVFHAAAHKHVPLMESNLEEAITNNIMGTRNLITIAGDRRIKNFILISTDKAVNPTSIMGVSKRIAEMEVLNEAKKHNLSFSVVRFGNVLGSRGSVVRTFEKQIAKGGPVKVTHPDITRFFMTIPEAVQLVLQSAIMNHGGGIYVLDMGEPVKIMDLAKDMINLSGLRYKEDIDIEITGLRPGEKLYEELFLKDEDYVRTENEKIFQVRYENINVPPRFEELLDNLTSFALANNKKINNEFAIIKQLVPEFTHEVPVLPKKFKHQPEVYILNKSRKII